MIVRPYSLQAFEDEHDAALLETGDRWYRRQRVPGRRIFEIAPWTPVTILEDLAPLVSMQGHRFVRVITPFLLRPMYVLLSDA